MLSVRQTRATRTNFWVSILSKKLRLIQHRITTGSEAGCSIAVVGLVASQVAGSSCGLSASPLRPFLLADTFDVVDDLAPIRARVYPAHATAFRALEVRQNVRPFPVGKAVERHDGIVPAPGARIPIGRANTIDQDSPKALRLHVGGAVRGPVAKTGVGFAAPGHAALERHQSDAANFQLLVARNGN
jgi:hypothetical protein